jgi:hypothetical protein
MNRKEIIERAKSLVFDDHERDSCSMYREFVQELSYLSGDAMTGLATGNRAGKPAERKQEILTPASITDFVRELFDGEIALDPCAATDESGYVYGLVEAPAVYLGPEKHGTDGLVGPWTDRTYVNPPFRDLKAWLAKAQLEALKSYPGNVRRIVLLAPVRTQRPWYRDAQSSCDARVQLNGVKFVGFDGVFPAPLELLIWNVERVTVSSTLAKPEHRKLGELA